MFFTRKKAPAAVEEESSPLPPVYIVLVSVEKDILIGPRKIISVPIVVPAVPDLELTWDVSVMRSNIGVSARFIPEGWMCRLRYNTSFFPSPTLTFSRCSAGRNCADFHHNGGGRRG